MGGAQAISAFVDDVADRLKSDQVIGANARLMSYLSDLAVTASHRFVMWEVLTNITGGAGGVSESYDIPSAHKHLKVSEVEWNAFINQAKAALDKLSVADQEQGELFALIAGIKDDIVPKPTLYDRLGGSAVIACVVDHLMNEAVKHPVLLANPKVKDGFQRLPLPALKYLITEFVCSNIGGPQKYGGRGMKVRQAPVFGLQ